MSDPTGPGWGSAASSSFSNPNEPGPLDTDVAKGLLERGQSLAEQGDWDLAAGTYSRVVGNGDPALHTAALLGLAECRYRLDDEPAALQAWITATQAPENDFTWQAWKALAVARVRSDDMAGAARAYREAGRRAPASEQAEIQARIGWLSKETGDEQGAERAFSRTRAPGVAGPMATYAILAVTIIISMVVLMGAPELRDWLWLDKGAMYNDGEYWRLLTVALVHGSFIHLGFNMYALWIIGPLVEGLYGPGRLMGMYLICVAAGSVASYATSAAPAVGASGGVFGLFGVLLVADRVHKPAMTRNARNLTTQIGMLIAINLVIGFTIPNIDNAAHIGGLLAGAALGFLVVPKGALLGSFWSRPSKDPVSPTAQAPHPAERSKPLRFVGVAGMVALIVMVAAIGPITYEPPLWWELAGEPAVTAEVAGDAVVVATNESGVVSGGLIGIPGSAEGQGHDRGAPGWAVRPFISQAQPQPGGDAALELELAVDRAPRDGLLAPERVPA